MDTKSVGNEMYGNELNFGPDKRRISRFTVKDRNLWSVRLDGRRLPVEAVQDISWEGACLRIGADFEITHNQRVSLQVFLKGELLFDVIGEVRWIKDASSFLEIQQIGIQFVDPKKRVEEIWEQSQIKDFVLDQNPSAEISHEERQWSDIERALKKRAQQIQFSFGRVFKAVLLISFLILAYYVTQLKV